MTALAREQTLLLRALNRHGVDFIVVGGVAAQIHGWRGATADLDITIPIDEPNVGRLNRALASVGAGPPSIGGLGTVFETRHGRLEIVRRADGIGEHGAWARHAKPNKVEEGLTVVVADPDDVLRSKEAAGREKDLATLPQIRRDLIDAGALAAEAARGAIAPERRAGGGPPAFLVTLLGSRPSFPDERLLWDQGAQLILDHRSRWDVTAADTDPLGPRGVGHRQTLDRRNLEAELKRIRHRLDRP